MKGYDAAYHRNAMVIFGVRMMTRDESRNISRFPAFGGGIEHRREGFADK